MVLFIRKTQTARITDMKKTNQNPDTRLNDESPAPIDPPAASNASETSAGVPDTRDDHSPVAAGTNANPTRDKSRAEKRRKAHTKFKFEAAQAKKAKTPRSKLADALAATREPVQVLPPAPVDTHAFDPNQEPAPSTALALVPFTSTEPLSDDERKELARCEPIFRLGFTSRLAAGEAAGIIRDRRLYRENYKTFEDYCRDQLRLTKTHVNRLIAVAGVVAILAPLGVNQVTEFLLRPLVGLEAEQMRTAWSKAVELAAGMTVTEKLVHQAASQFRPSRRRTHSRTVPTGQTGQTDPISAVLDELRSRLLVAQEAVTNGLTPVQVLPLLARAIKSVDSLRDRLIPGTNTAEQLSEESTTSGEKHQTKGKRMTDTDRVSQSNNGTHGTGNTDDFVVFLFNDEGDGATLERIFEHENMALFHLWPADAIHFRREGLPEYCELFVVQSDPEDFGPSDDSSLCQPSVMFLTLTVKNEVPDPVKLPKQLIEDGWEGIVGMINESFPTARKVIIGDGLAQSDVPPGWKLLGTNEA